jgi:hypothetical protein
MFECQSFASVDKKRSRTGHEPQHNTNFFLPSIKNAFFKLS